MSLFITEHSIIRVTTPSEYLTDTLYHNIGLLKLNYIIAYESYLLVFKAFHDISHISMICQQQALLYNIKKIIYL